MPKKTIIEAIASTDLKSRRWRSTFATARLAYEAGEPRQAETLLARALEMTHEMPERNFAEASTVIGSAAVLLAQHRSREAGARLRKIISKLEGNPDPLFKELLAVALRFNAQALADANDEREAEKELKRSAQILKELGDDAIVQLAYTLSDLCGLYLVQGRLSEAETQITRALRIINRTLGPDTGEYKRADMIYQYCLPVTDETRTATAFDGMRKMQYSFGGKHPNVDRALHRYMKVLVDRGDHARIEEAKREFGV